MNREIKFRAWDKTTDSVWDPKPISKMFNFTIHSVPFYIGNTYNETGNSFTKRFEIMQYTGLLDKNGTEIYEGDILWDAHNEEHGRIVFDEGKFIVNWTTHAEDLIECLYGIYVELAGNIYEHPELLERDEE